MTTEPDNITKEKKLLEIWREAQRVPTPWINIAATWGTGILASIYVLLPQVKTHEITAITRNIAEISFSASLGLLGFLLAAYVVFATVCRQDLLVELTKHTEDESQLSYFKYNTFPFVAMLAEILVFALASFVIVAFGGQDGLVPKLAKAVNLPDFSMRGIASVTFVFITTFTIHVLMILKSVIRNVHHVIATSVRWTREKQDEEEANR